MSLSSQGIEYDVTDIKKHSDEFIEKFNELKNINDSNKISIWSNKIYLDGSVFGTQWFMRKFTGQGRNTVKDYFEQQFSDYIKLLEMMIAAERTIRYIDDRYKELLNIMNDNKEFINTIKSGLDHTKNMYKDDIELGMSDIITNIISNLDSYITNYDNLRRLYDTRIIDAIIPKGFTITDSGSDPGSPILNPFSCMSLGIAPRLLMMNRERSQSEN